MTLALVACGDEKTSSVIEVDSPATSVGDTASTAIDQDVSDISDNDSVSVGSDSVSQKTVLANSGPCSLNRTNGGDLAYLTNNEKVGYQIIIPDVSAIGYYTDTELKAERIGDTLEVRHYSDTVAVLAWICYVYYTFNIPAEDADVKYLKYIDYVYKVVPGPAPEKAPDTSCFLIPSQYRAPEEGDNDSTFCIITTFIPSAEGVYDTSCTFFPYDLYKSSSSIALPVESSSSVSAKSSSSVAKVADKHQFVTDANAQCLANGVVDDPLVDGNLDVVPVDTVRVRDEKLPPVALRYVGTERTGFTIENLSLTCGVVVDTLDVDVSGDTVYVKAKFDNTNAQRCICNSKVDFAVENNPAYGHATVLVFDNVAGSNPNTMEIVDMSVVTVEEITGHRLAKDIKLECKNDRQTARKFTMASNSFVMDPIDTTSTKVAVAGRRVGDDGFDTIVIPEVMMPCAIVFESFDVYADNGTLYVKPKVDPDSPITNCICPTRVSFKVEQNEAFSNANYLVFDREEPMPLVNSVPFDASVLKD
jgi:hypothetical protein